MVQTNMGVRASDSVSYDVIDAVPRERIIKKQVAVNGEFVERQFIRIPVRNADTHARGTSNLEEWCYKHYNSPKYLGSWLKVSSYIILDEKTYTHRKLCE